MITTGGIMTSCKYMLPCGYCELKKEMCSVNEPFTITQTWPMPKLPTEITTCSAERKEETIKEIARFMAKKDWNRRAENG